MLRTYFIISNLIAISVANPFQKYPFVFLLDIGNEEIQKTNAEQIRVSAPGGSLAIRYPAIGDGDTIAHVRVSGVDFGSDLKSNVVDGGPGYKYVVIVLMGNPGVKYDAVVTIETMKGVNNLANDIPGIADNVDIKHGNSGQPGESNYVEENGIEDIDSNSETKITSNVEQTQSSDTFYNYAHSEKINDINERDQDEDETLSDSKDIYAQEGDDSTEDDEDQDTTDDDDDRTDEERENDYEGEIDDDDDQYQRKGNNNPKAEKYIVNTGFVNRDYENDESVEFVDSNLYGKYKALEPHLYDNVKVYPQEAINDQQEVIMQSSSQVDPMEIDQMFNDEEVHNYSGKYKDVNNNYFDSHDSNAVAS